MKALLIQTAQDVIGIKVDGRIRAHAGPDYATGWGLVDAKAAVDLRLKAPDGSEFTPWILDPANPALAAKRNGAASKRGHKPS